MNKKHNQKNRKQKLKQFQFHYLARSGGMQNLKNLIVKKTILMQIWIILKQENNKVLVLFNIQLLLGIYQEKKSKNILEFNNLNYKICRIQIFKFLNYLNNTILPLIRMNLIKNMFYFFIIILALNLQSSYEIC